MPAKRLPAELEPVGPSALRVSLHVRVMVTRLWRRLRAVTDADDITPAQASVLTRIGGGEVVTAGALAAAERVRPQSMTVTLAGLERMGLIARVQDPADGRRHLVELTTAGRDRFEDVRQARVEWLATSLQRQYTEDERQLIIAALTLLERLVS